MFTARYELSPYIKQIAFRLYKVNVNYCDHVLKGSTRYESHLFFLKYIQI